MSDWQIIKGATDMLITGPGNLVISLKDFDRQKVEFIDKGVIGGSTAATVIQYPLDANITLEMITVRAGTRTIVKMHLGELIQWTVPEDFAKTLQEAFLATNTSF